MTKRKKGTAESGKVKINILSGKVVKAKHSESIPETRSARKMHVKLHRTPLGLRQQNYDVAATPFQDKCTSTPLHTGLKPNGVVTQSRIGRAVKPNPKYKDYTVALTPILADIGNLEESRGKKENKIKSFTEGLDGDQNVPKASSRECQKRKDSLSNAAGGRKSLNPVLRDDAGRFAPSHGTKRRSVGVRRMVLSDEDDSIEFASTRRRKASQITPEPHDHSLVKRLRADWSNTTIEEIPTQIRSSIRQIRSPHTQPVRPPKRWLTPLIEVTVDDESKVSIARPPQSTSSAAKPIEDAYSSSDEFESKAEKNSSRSKRAPTWKDLSNKVLESMVHTTPKVTVRRSRMQSRIPILSPKEEDSYIPALTPKVMVRRSRRQSKIPTPSPKETILASTPKVRLRKLRIQSTIPTLAPKKNNNCVPGPKPRVRLRRSRMLTEVVPTLCTEELSALYPKERDNCIPLETNNVSPPLNIHKTHRDASNSVPRTVDTVDLNEAVNSAEDLIDEIEDAVSPSTKSQNLQNKSDLIEQILSSSDNADEENNAPNHATQSNVANISTTKKFFHSRIDNTIAVPTPVKAVKVRKSRGRRKKQDNIYEFLSQSSSDTVDPAADVIQKMIKSGKVVVAKHKKGTGKLRISRKPAVKKKIAKVEDVFVKPKPLTRRKPLQEKLVHTVHFDDESNFDDGGAAFFEEAPKERDQRGFSDLARSAMIKQAADKSENTPPQRRTITDRKKLLQMAQKFVGSPPLVRTPSSSPSTVAHLSPISGSRSPWRVDDDRLPNLSFFSRNSDNLPSFSSDHIPLTPPKNKFNSKSSFSSNDSNMENIAPPSAKATSNENSNQSARRALRYRSPLKPINIIEVVNLPPLAMNNIGKETNKDITRKEKSGSRNTSETNLFGFEDFIDDDDDDLPDATLDQSAVSNTQRLRMNLQRLKRLRPEKPVATTSKNTRIKPVFDERPKQKTLKQMLCSTMIERQSESKMANDDSQHDNYFNDGSDADLSNLFKDPEPETTFNDSNPRRTYSRPFRKKKKLRNNFFFFMDSDVSDDEEEDKHHEKKSKKRLQKDRKETAELNKFVDEFNEMCKEVSQYELIVE